MKWGTVDVAAMRACAFVTLYWAFGRKGCVANAGARVVWIRNFVQVAAGVADKNIGRVPRVLGEHIAGEQIEALGAGRAGAGLDPEEILDVGIGTSGHWATSLVEATDFTRQVRDELLGGLLIGGKIEGLDLFADNPCGHWINICADDITTKAISFEKWRAATHERVGHGDPLEAVGAIVSLIDGLRAELREEKATEESPRSPGKPFMNCDDWAVVLLNLFFAQCQFGYECNIKVSFNHQGTCSPRSVPVVAKIALPDVRLKTCNYA